MTDSPGKVFKALQCGQRALQMVPATTFHHERLYYGSRLVRWNGSDHRAAFIAGDVGFIPTNLDE